MNIFFLLLLKCKTVMNIFKQIKRKGRILYQRIIGYHYHANRYPESFLRYTHIPNKETHSIPKRRIFCFWTGTNPMNKNRKKAILSLQEKSDVEVIVITPSNLDEYILPNYPLHKAFNNLSLVHRSDYLRCYFMHHYGGGYSDVKECTKSWKKAFDKLEARKDAYILGYTELSKRTVAKLPNKLGADLRKFYSYIIGNCAYICVPYTPFTYEWYYELHNRMDNYAEELAKNKGNIMGDNDGYPIPWTGILGDIYHPLCLKYNKNIIHDNTICPSFSDYR